MLLLLNQYFNIHSFIFIQYSHIKLQYIWYENRHYTYKNWSIARYTRFKNESWGLWSKHQEITEDSPKSLNKIEAYFHWGPNACVKGHLEPTHLKSSPLFTFSTKSLGQDSPSVHLFSKTIGSRFTTSKIKLGEDSPSWFIYFRSRFTLK